MPDCLQLNPGPQDLPDWVPTSARLYLAHTELGLSMRRLAKRAGCHASTVMRQIRKLENRRDDRLVDEALKRLRGEFVRPWSTGLPNAERQKDRPMTAINPAPCALPDKQELNHEALRILRRMCESSAMLAVAADMEKAVVVREDPQGNSTRTAVVDRGVAEAMALKDWIDCDAPGRVSRYHITSEGRAALARLLAHSESRAQAGFAEIQSAFSAASDDRVPDRLDRNDEPSRRVRYTSAETPLTLLARRKDRNGNPFLSADLVAAGERLREDFELSRIGALAVQGWDHVLSTAERDPGHPDDGYGPGAARERIAKALRDLGPGLGDVALRCCCYLEGLEAAEKRMGWSARSGKIVLRIALQRLKLHYERLGDEGALIG
ncbi:MAG: DUF6456 domain-containing protein [Thalassovita sp.]|nr:DUF6456 domain-containing protein [Thalassovita sp.]